MSTWVGPHSFGCLFGDTPDQKLHARVCTFNLDAVAHQVLPAQLDGPDQLMLSV
jgi:hypothetical protein